MAGFSIEVQDRELHAALRGLRGRIDDLRPAMQTIGQHLVTLADLSFRHQRDPWGRAWPRLAAATLRQRRGSRAQILRDTGRLAGSISYRADSDSVTVGTNVIYAAIHQFGGTIEHQARTGTLYFRQNKRGEVGQRLVKKGRSNFAQDVTIGAHNTIIPRRAFLPINAAGQVEIPRATLDDILDALAERLGVGGGR